MDGGKHLSEEEVGYNHFLHESFTARRSVILLCIVFVALEIWIVLQPYNVMTMDIADATTNYIWVPHYAQGVFAIPYSQWTGGITQSVVVLYNGQYMVLNEKGPGFSMLIVPFYLIHAQWLFAPLIVLLAVVSTYMLAFRLTNWKVAFIASLTTMLNLSVLIMWAHYYWTDAATMHLLVCSIWLLVESNYRMNGRSSDPKNPGTVSLKVNVAAVVLSLLSGLVFGAAISTRYPVALILPAILLYMLTFYIIRYRISRSDPNAKHSLSKGFILSAVFLLGLSVVLIPLMYYNMTYFGGPFNSGYDATSLVSFSSTHSINLRNQSQNWFASPLSDLAYAGRNFVYLLPLLIFRMPALLLLPAGLWYVRKNRAALVLLSFWIFIAMITYLSVYWVIDYDVSRTYIQTVWEPRYFMPAIPPLSIFAGIALERFSIVKRDGKAKSRSLPFLLFMAAIILVSLIPLALFFLHGNIIPSPVTHKTAPFPGAPALSTFGSIIQGVFRL